MTLKEWIEATRKTSRESEQRKDQEALDKLREIIGK